MSQPDVIAFIQRSYVPVAANLYEIRQDKGPGGEFFRKLQKQRPEQYQGLYAATADAKVLVSHQRFQSDKTWASEVLTALKKGISEFGAVPVRSAERVDPSPNRGVGIQSQGAVTLAIYTRLAIKGIPLREVPDPTIDSLPLTAKEWAWLSPPREGKEWSLPETLARKFSRVLGPRDEDSMPRPHEVGAVDFKGKILLERDDLAYLGFQGYIEGNHVTQGKKLTKAQAKLVGTGVFDRKAGELRSLTWVFDGVFRGPIPYDAPQIFHAVVEWRLK